MNVSIISIMARNYAHFNFSSNFSGFVAYTRPGGQDFTYIPVDNGTIRVVLPENFTAGTIFLGYIQPNPDNITKDSSGREVLVWNNAQNKKIRVRYHQKGYTGNVNVYVWIPFDLRPNCMGILLLQYLCP